MSFFIAEKIKNNFACSKDFVLRELKCKSGTIFIMFLKSMTDKNEIAKQIICPIFESRNQFDFDTLKNSIILSTEVEEIKEEKITQNILLNKVVMIFENRYLSIDLEKYAVRSPTEPPTSPNILGPREGFVESAKTNISLIRKRLPNPNLVLDEFVVGRETKSKVYVMYLKNIANKKVVKDILSNIKKIDISGVIDSYYIAEFLKKKPNSMFEQVGYQEKPDVVVAKMLEGRVAIVVDGSPIVLSLPYMVFEDLQSSNDYYTNYVYVNLIRIIRTIGIIIATVIPGLYLSIRLYSYKVLPINYVITIANSTKNLPFTPVSPRTSAPTIDVASPKYCGSLKLTSYKI